MSKTFDSEDMYDEFLNLNELNEYNFKSMAYTIRTPIEKFTDNYNSFVNDYEHIICDSDYNH